MPHATDLHSLPAGFFLWHAYDPAVRCDLFSTALKSANSLLLVDPIPLAPAALAELGGHGAISAIALTNSNHLRAAESFALQFRAPVHAARDAFDELPEATLVPITAGEQIVPGVTAIEIAGAAPGEFALYCADDSGTVIIGDALINFAPSGFALLPAKYCRDQKRMRRALEQLLELQFERLFFGHGMPILFGARAKLEALLHS